MSVPTINEHLADLYAQGEIDEEPSFRNFRTVQTMIAARTKADRILAEGVGLCA